MTVPLSPIFQAQTGQLLSVIQIPDPTGTTTFPSSMVLDPLPSELSIVASAQVAEDAFLATLSAPISFLNANQKANIENPTVLAGLINQAANSIQAITQGNRGDTVLAHPEVLAILKATPSDNYYGRWQQYNTSYLSGKFELWGTLDLPYHTLYVIYNGQSWIGLCDGPGGLETIEENLVLLLRASRPNSMIAAADYCQAVGIIKY